MAQTIAIIGASNDRGKYGNKAVRAFAAGGWTVYPVNPKEEVIEGLKCYASILDVPEPIDRVSIYIAPRYGKRILGDIAAKKPKEVFFNPGTEDEEILAQARDLGLNAIQACSIVNIGLRPDMFGDD